MIASCIPIVTTMEMKEIDRLMVEEYGITLLQMMENAGSRLAELSRRLVGGDLAGKKTLVLCGGGANGGGGMAVARHLINSGCSVEIALAVPEENLNETARHQLYTLRKMSVSILNQIPSKQNFDLIIDALIGYGLQGAPREKTAQWIIWANALDCPILALDIPSGLDADSGNAPGVCIKADATMTLALPKKGLMAEQAQELVGDLYLADISVPKQLLNSLKLITESMFFENSIIQIRSKIGTIE